VLLVAGAVLAVGDVARAQVSCQQFGNQTICNNGQTFQRFGNQTYDNRGTSWQQFGNQTFASNGAVCTRFGNHIHCQ
jgi:hypothetical protein